MGWLDSGCVTCLRVCLTLSKRLEALGFHATRLAGGPAGMWSQQVWPQWYCCAQATRLGLHEQPTTSMWLVRPLLSCPTVSLCLSQATGSCPHLNNGNAGHPQQQRQATLASSQAGSNKCACSCRFSLRLLQANHLWHAWPVSSNGQSYDTLINVPARRPALLVARELTEHTNSSLIAINSRYNLACN